MKKFISSLLILTATFGLTGCEDFLQVNPKQVLDENLLVKPSDMEGSVTAAYARMTDIPSWDSPFSPWWSGSLRSDDSSIRRRRRLGRRRWMGIYGNLCEFDS